MTPSPTRMDAALKCWEIIQRWLDGHGGSHTAPWFPWVPSSSSDASHQVIQRQAVEPCEARQFRRRDVTRAPFDFRNDFAAHPNRIGHLGLRIGRQTTERSKSSGQLLGFAIDDYVGHGWGVSPDPRNAANASTRAWSRRVIASSAHSSVWAATNRSALASMAAAT